MRSYRDVIDLLTASQMTLTPTIGIQGGFRLQTIHDPSWIDDPRIRALYPESVWRPSQAMVKTHYTPEDVERRAELIRPLENTVFRVVRAGGREQRRPSRPRPSAPRQTSARSSPGSCRSCDLGGNPLANIKDLRRVKRVVMDGRVFTTEEPIASAVEREQLR